MGSDAIALSIIPIFFNKLVVDLIYSFVNIKIPTSIAFVEFSMIRYGEFLKNDIKQAFNDAFELNEVNNKDELNETLRIRYGCK